MSPPHLLSLLEAHGHTGASCENVRAALALELSERHLDRRNVLLAAKLRIKNEGRGLMKLTKLRFDLYRVRPLGEGMRSRIDAGKPYGAKRIDADWPVIDQRIRCWSEDLPELEPGESDEFCCDFFLCSPEETVFLYAYVENVKKKRGRRELGWSVTAFHDLEPISGQGRLASLLRR